MVTIRAGTPRDRARIREFLQAANLPTGDLDEPKPQFVVATTHVQRAGLRPRWPCQGRFRSRNGKGRPDPGARSRCRVAPGPFRYSSFIAKTRNSVLSACNSRLNCRRSWGISASGTTAPWPRGTYPGGSSTNSSCHSDRSSSARTSTEWMSTEWMSTEWMTTDLTARSAPAPRRPASNRRRPEKKR
jgi:hypothetical protein